MSSISQRRTDMGGEATGPQCITQGKILTFKSILIRNKRSICIFYLAKFNEIDNTTNPSISHTVVINITLASVRFLGLISYYINRPLRTQKTLIIIKYYYLYP